MRLPIAVVGRFKAWVCAHSLATIAGSNHAGDKALCLLSALFFLMVEVTETGHMHAHLCCARVSLSVIRCNINPLNLQE